MNPNKSEIKDPITELMMIPDDSINTPDDSINTP